METLPAPKCASVPVGNVVLWGVLGLSLPTFQVCYHRVCTSVRVCVCVCVSVRKTMYSEMSSDGRHLNGPNTDLLVSLDQLLQAGHSRERQLCLSVLPPLQRTLLLAGHGGELLRTESQPVAVARAGGHVRGSLWGEAAHVGLLRVDGGAAAAGL